MADRKVSTPSRIVFEKCMLEILYKNMVNMNIASGHCIWADFFLTQP